MHLLITGASGKLGRAAIPRLLADFPQIRITALTHSRDLPFADERLTVAKGDISDRSFVDAVMPGVTHVLHMATCKEIPERIMDVTVKGMFWLLEAFREQGGKYFILLGGDAAVGHFVHPWDHPITEADPHRAAPGCYSLSKVLEEVMLTQAHIQYGLRGCCLRAPWIMADDDLKYALSFGEDVFGAPRWCDLVDAEIAHRYTAEGRIPLALAADGQPLRRGIVAVEDVVSAILTALAAEPSGCETFNVAMDTPFDYGEATRYLKATRNLDAVDIATPYHSVTLDNSKAKNVLGWTPAFDTERLIEAAWEFVPPEGRERKIVYPG